MTEVKRLQIIYEVNDSQFIAGLNRMKQASQDANKAILKAAEDAEKGQVESGNAAQEAAASTSSAAAKTAAANKEAADSAKQVTQANEEVAASAKRASDQITKAANGSRVGIQSLIESNIRSTQSGKSAEESWRSMSAELARLESKYDPAAQAARQYEKAVEEVNMAHKAGLITTAQHQAAIARMQAEYTKTGSVMGSFRQNIGNMSYQVQDMAVQLAMGTDAMIVMGQQLPQMLVGFGAAGAVLGLVAALAFPAISLLTKLGGSTKDAAERMEDLQKAVDEYQAAADAASVTTEELREKYGNASGAAREFLMALMEISEVETLKTFNTELDSLIDRFGKLAELDFDAIEKIMGAESQFDLDPDLVKRMADEGIAAFDTLEIEKIAKELKTTEENALALARGLQEVAKAEGTENQIAALQDFQQLLIDTFGPYEEMNTAQRELYNSIVETGEVATGLTGALEDSAAAADGVAAAAAGIDLSGAINDAYSLADALNSAAAQMSRLEARQASAAARADLRERYKGDAVGYARAEAGLEFNETLPSEGGVHDVLTPEQRSDFEARRKAYMDEAEAIAVSEEAYKKWTSAQRDSERQGRKKSGGKKSGGDKEEPFFGDIEKQAQGIQRQIELIGKSSEEVAAARAKWALLDEAKKRNMKVDEALNEKIEAQASKVGRLTKALEENREAFEEYENGIKEVSGVMTDVLGGAQSLREGLKEIFRGIAMDILNSGIQDSLRTAFKFDPGGGGGFGSLILSAIGGRFGSGTESYEGGGYTGNGPRSGGVDGRGGRLAVIHPQETILDHTRGQGMSSSSMDVRVYVDQDGNWQAAVENISGNVAAETVNNNNRTMPDRLRRQQAHPRRRT